MKLLSIVIVVLIIGAVLFNSLVQVYNKKKKQSATKERTVNFVIYSVVVLLIVAAFANIVLSIRNQQVLEHTSKQLEVKTQEVEELNEIKATLEVEKQMYKDSLKKAYKINTRNLDSLKRFNVDYDRVQDQLVAQKATNQMSSVQKEYLEQKLEDFQTIIRFYEIEHAQEELKIKALYDSINKKDMVDAEIKEMYYQQNQAYTKLKIEYNKLKFINKGMEAMLKGNTAKGEEKTKHYLNALFYFRRGDMDPNNENYKLVKENSN